MRFHVISNIASNQQKFCHSHRDPYEFSDSDSDSDEEEEDNKAKKKKKKKKVPYIVMYSCSSASWWLLEPFRL